MKKLQINENHRALIESVIRESPKFIGHEDLLDIFCEAIYKKSYLVIDAIRDIPRLRRHLTMISDGCMDSIIREKQKFDDIEIYKQPKRTKSKQDIVSVKKPTPLDFEDETDRNIEKKQKENIVNLKEEIQNAERYDAVSMLIDPLEFCPQKRVSEHTVDRLINIVKQINRQYPQKRYYEIFYLRYIKKYRQAAIAQEMQISQIELSKRFVELINLTRESI